MKIRFIKRIFSDKLRLSAFVIIAVFIIASVSPTLLIKLIGIALWIIPFYLCFVIFKKVHVIKLRGTNISLKAKAFLNGMIQGFLCGSAIAVLILILYLFQYISNSYGKGDPAGLILIFALVPFSLFVWPILIFIGGIIGTLKIGFRKK